MIEQIAKPSMSH